MDKSIQGRIPYAWGEVQLATFDGERNHFVSLDMHACAIGSRGVYILSTLGSRQDVIAAVRMIRLGPCRHQLSLFNPDGTWRATHFRTGDLSIKKLRLDRDHWHLVVMSLNTRFLPSNSDEALWQTLTSERYTTPMLRSWIPYLREDLERRGLLSALTCVGCSSAILYAETKDIDDAVTRGLQTGAIKIGDEQCYQR